MRSTSLTVQFTFTKGANGAYTAVLNSPDNAAIKNTPVSGVSWDGTNLKLQVPTLSGSYAGALKDGKVNGQWTQPGGDLPLVLAPYQKPVMSTAAMDALVGTWLGNVNVRGQTIGAMFQFKKDAKGELVATFGIPDQGLTDQPVTNVEFDGSKLSFNVPRIQGGYSGTLASGQITGNLKIGGPGIPPEGLPLALKKGEYVAKIYPLKFSTEQFAAINGTWKGKLEITPPQGQKVVLNLVVRFGTSENGQYIGSMDSPDQKAMNIPISDASYADGKLMFKVDVVKGEYNGTLSGKTITGTWAQGPGTTYSAGPDQVSHQAPGKHVHEKQHLLSERAGTGQPELGKNPPLRIHFDGWLPANPGRVSRSSCPAIRSPHTCPGAGMLVSG